MATHVRASLQNICAHIYSSRPSILCFFACTHILIYLAPPAEAAAAMEEEEEEEEAAETRWRASAQRVSAWCGWGWVDLVGGRWEWRV